MLAITMTIIAVMAIPPSPEILQARKEVAVYLTTRQWPELDKTAHAWAKRSRIERVRLANLLMPKLHDETDIYFTGIEGRQINELHHQRGYQAVSIAQHVSIHELNKVGGRAAWALSLMFDLDDLPPMSHIHGTHSWNLLAEEIAIHVRSHPLFVTELVDEFITHKDWHKLFYKPHVWAELNDEKRHPIAKLLLARLTDRTCVGLSNGDSVINLYRQTTGDLAADNALCGSYVPHDPFLIGGRAAYALSQLYDLDTLPELNAGLSKAEWDKQAKQIAGFITPQSLILREQVVGYFKTNEWPELQRIAQAWTKLPEADRVHLATILLPDVYRRGRIDLRNTGDLIILYRFDTGDLKFRDEGTLVRQDLFISGGRAAWAFAQLFPKVKLPELNDGMSREEWYNRTKAITERVNEAITK